jgi:holo-[acyl-carrier protein] synthase
VRIVGHGVDLVSTSRIAQMLAEHGDQFLERCFGPPEREYMAGGRRYHEHLAARFAAKEAAMKALGTGLAGGVTWHDFQIERQDSGAPRLLVGGQAARLAAAAGIDQWLISLTHTDDAALASVLAINNSHP